MTDVPIMKKLAHQADTTFWSIVNYMSSYDIIDDITQIAPIAGGSILRELDDHHPETSDIDIFILDNNAENFNEVLKIICKYYGLKAVSTISNKKEGYSSVFTCNVRHDLVYQIIFTDYKTVTDLLSNFDMDYVQAAYYQKKIVTTPEFEKALETKEISHIRDSMYKISRIAKSLRKGYTLSSKFDTEHIHDLLKKVDNSAIETKTHDITTTTATLPLPIALKTIDYDTGGCVKIMAPKERTVKLSNTLIHCEDEIFRIPFVGKTREIVLKFCVKWISDIPGCYKIKLNTTDILAHKIEIEWLNMKTNQDSPALEKDKYYKCVGRITTTSGTMFGNPVGSRKFVAIGKTKEITETDFNQVYYGFQVKNE